MLDCVVLTDARYVDPPQVDWYVRQVLDEDGAVVDALRARGLRVARMAWDDPRLLEGDIRSALFRTTWDYFERWPEFSAWLGAAQQQLQLLNAAPLLHWNLDKRYLAELHERGVSVVPTHWAPRGEGTLADIVAQRGWEEVVVKPAISGAGRDTFRARLPDADAQTRFQALRSVEDMLVQPFLPKILDRGEVSIIVFGDEVSHAVRKVAAEGEFRVQDDHGGTVVGHQPTEAERALALQAVAACPSKPLYARVDMVEMDGTPAIMELELVEPELFFRFDPQAADRLAKVVASALDKPGH